MRPPGREILDVMISMCPSFDTDDFGKEEVPPLPMSFDRVCDGSGPRSSAPLFRLPTEILGIILHHVAPDSLASLALVNRDCLQWARSRRFASIHLDYSPSSWGLLGPLLEEASSGFSPSCSVSSLPRLGLCIRRITVATLPYWVTCRHGVELGGEFDELSEDEKTKRMVDASSAFYDTYIPCIRHILNPIVLPHLELLDWEDRISLSQSFFEALAVSRIKYLRLFRVPLKQEFDIAAQLSSVTFNWPLRTLHLELYPHHRFYGKLSTSPLGSSILRLCSPTLEDLKLRTMEIDDYYSFGDSTINPLPRFPHLRNLDIGRVGFKDSSMLEALVQSNLRYLQIGSHWNSVYMDFFEKIGTLPALNTFVWDGYLSDEPPCSFLHANSHIKKLTFLYAVSSVNLETKIVPLLEKNFRNLASLRMIWKGKSIAKSALRGICTLKTLKQVSLSAGEQYGWKHDWVINHDCLRHYLSSLPLLERLAFSRDSYSFEDSRLGVESYYSQVDILETDDSEKWEHRHRQRMLDEANKYVSVMPRLEWIYLGQIPMSVEKGDLAGSKCVRALSETRDGCWTFLRKMFGGSTD